MRQTHVAGDKLFVDWAGDTVPIIDPMTGEVHEAHLFIAVLGECCPRSIGISVRNQSEHLSAIRGIRTT
jgi:transposase